MMSRRRTAALVILGVCVAACLFVLAAKSMKLMLDGALFQMTLTPAEGHSVVQFIQPDQGLASPEFPVDLVIDAPQVVELRSGDTVIPGCTIEFHDVTLLPGRFRIRIGGTVFDVMERGIFIDEKEHQWRLIEPGPH